MKAYCPYCREEKEYNIEKREVKEFRGKEIDAYENVAVCSNCKKDLYLVKLEQENNQRIYAEYRKVESIIAPQDIVNLRNKYDISQRELTAILGFGKMTINRYERGGLPTKSQSDYIKLLIEDESKFIEKVKEAFANKHITAKTYNKIVSKGDSEVLAAKDMQDLIRKIIINGLSRTPDIYNGYKELDLEKIENLVSYIASKVDNLTVTSLNKYLWYIDMVAFNEECAGITGITYERGEFGPAVIDKQYRAIAFLSSKYLKDEFEYDEGTITKMISKNNYDLTIFSEEELNIIDRVICLLKDKTVIEISRVSQGEDACKKTKKGEIISFEYAININLD